MKKISIAMLLSLLTSATLIAAVSPTFEEWAKGPARHLMTPEDLNRWKEIESDEEAKKFIDLFWARRDPTPQTAKNEFREEFEARVAVADRQFSTLKVRGAMSDPGRVLILLGPPTRVGSRGAEGRSRSNTNVNPGAGGSVVGVPSARAEGARQVWTWAAEKKPAFVPQKELEILFIDEGGNKWQMANTERTNPQYILKQAVSQYIFSPALTSVPAYTESLPSPTVDPSIRMTSFRNADLKDAWNKLRADSKPVGSSYLTWGEFVTPAGEVIVPVQLYLPGNAKPESGTPLTFFGVVENEAGEVVEVHEAPANLKSTGNDAYVDKTLRLEPGKYTATFGLAEGGRVVSLSRAPITIEGVDPGASGISPLLLSTNIYPIQEAWTPLDPFTFGGLKVVPKGDSQFPATGDLWYFFEMRNPGLTDQGAPKVQVKVDIDGKTGKGPVRLALPMADAEIAKLKGTENRYAVGMAIPLESFEAGDYTMKIRVVDSILKKNYDFERKFKVGAL